MNKLNKHSAPKSLLKSLTPCVAFTIFSMTAVPANADPFAAMFDAASDAYTEVDTSSVDLYIAETESDIQEQAYNAEVLWEAGVDFGYSESQDFIEETEEKEVSSVARTSITLNKTLWDKAIDYSIDSAQNNIRTAQINQFESRQELVESLALASLDYLAARDIAASVQKRSLQFINLRNKIAKEKKAGDAEDIDMDDVESQVQDAQFAVLEERTNLKKAKIRLNQLTNNSIDYISPSRSFFTASNDIRLGSVSSLISSALRQNLELKALQSDEISLQKNVLSKRAGTAPKFDFTSSVAKEWSKGDVDQETFDVSVGVNMEMLLYTGGLTNNEIKLAKLELLSAERETNQKKREIIGEIRTLSAEFSGSLSSYKSLLKVHKPLKKKTAEINASLASDEIDDLDVFETLDDEVELNNSLIRQYYDLLKIKVEIMKLTGELDMNSLNQLRALLLNTA